MTVLAGLVCWLEHKDPFRVVDAILVLDGGQSNSRLTAALELLRQGRASCLVVSQSVHEHPRRPEGIVRTYDLGKAVYWVFSDAASTRAEVRETLPLLSQLSCNSVLVVTSGYHTRRARRICERELAPHGIQVRVFAAPTPGFDPKHWWKSRAGRVAVLFELFKLLCTWLHLDPPFPSDLRHRLKLWVHRALP